MFIPSMTPKASIIIPAYDNAALLPRCLRALFAQTAPPADYEILLVDDGSSDDTAGVVEALKTEAPCALRYIRQEHRGRAIARNRGIREAQGGYVIFLDSDMIANTGFVAAHLRAHAEPGRIVHGLVINTYNQENPTVEKAKLTDISRAFFATGNVSIARDKLIEAGFFDEDFVEYGWEDLELGGRLRRLGLSAVKCPEAVSHHLQKRLSAAGIPGMIRKEKERGHTAVLFLRKNPGLRVRLMTNLTPVAFALDRLALAPFGWTERPATLRLMAGAEDRGRRWLFNLLAFCVRNHAYVAGLREGIAEQRRKRD